MPINLTSISSVNLSGLRTEFKELCGIPDMPNSTVDKWLNRGIKLLDQLTDAQYGLARQAIAAAMGTRLVQFPSECRVINEVYLIDSGGVRTRVPFLTHKEFYELYSDDISSNDVGLPVACTFDNVRQEL